tara:strand:- start:271 stop:438 length:168 start_codon:yes stop_codon:yes gene_type:complete
MGDWIFQAILSMLVAALGYIYFLKIFVTPPNTSVFDIGNNDLNNIEQLSNQASPS